MAVDNPYGVVAHVTRDEFPRMEDTYKMLSFASVGSVRCDVDMWRIRTVQEDGTVKWDFSSIDRVVDNASRHGIVVLPILEQPPKSLDPIWEHCDEFGEFVFRFVARYRGRIPAVEIWNEENIQVFWRSEPDAEKYLRVLKSAYAAAKRANPSVTVVLGGTAYVPFDYIERLYELGGADCFDVMNVHPYAHPNPPEGGLDGQIERLRALMKRYGDGEKPIWITEIGWPTHATNLAGEGNLLRAGLRIADPTKQTWRVVYADTIADDVLPDDDKVDALRTILPPGSSLSVCGPRGLVGAIEKNAVDAVVYPFDESFPEDTVSAVVAFVKRGGTLVDCGGVPMYYAYRNLPDGRQEVVERPAWKAMKELGIGLDACIFNDQTAPASMRVYATPKALEAGVKQEPTGFEAERYVTDANLGPGDQMIPLLSGKSPKDGRTMHAACVYLLGGGEKGRVIISCLIGNARGTTKEANQGAYLARSLGILFSKGVEKVFWYEFRAPESDPYYSEEHFGLVHDNFVPKPAWGALANFIEHRPPDSTQIRCPLKSEDGLVYNSQWMLPDGRVSGMVWVPGAHAILRKLRFDSPTAVRFCNIWGLPLPSVKVAEGIYSVKVGDSPVYFVGGKLNLNKTKGAR